MLDGLRRWLSGSPGNPQQRVFEEWADRQRARFRHVKHDEGCVVEGRLGSQAWRLEWGPPQRDYIAGMELRLMAETPWSHDLTALVLRRPLVAMMEKAVYDQIVDDVRTRMDADTPVEMRWLVLYPRLSAAEMGPLREHWAAVSSVKPWMLGWLASPLGEALQAVAKAVPDTQPSQLSVHRGRLLLRTAFPDPDTQALQRWWTVFEQGLRQAPVLAEGAGRHEPSAEAED